MQSTITETAKVATMFDKAKSDMVNNFNFRVPYKCVLTDIGGVTEKCILFQITPTYMNSILEHISDNDILLGKDNNKVALVFNNQSLMYIPVTTTFVDNIHEESANGVKIERRFLDLADSDKIRDYLVYYKIPEHVKEEVIDNESYFKCRLHIGVFADEDNTTKTFVTEQHIVITSDFLDVSDEISLRTNWI